MADQTQKHTAPKKTSWAVSVFYLLIVFEFFYMASPFAAYFYSVYGPGLNFMNSNPALAWVSSMFLPHIVVDTSSSLLNQHNIVGSILFFGGFLTFCVGAGQVYYYKLAKKEPFWEAFTISSGTPNMFLLPFPVQVYCCCGLDISYCCHLLPCFLLTFFSRKLKRGNVKKNLVNLTWPIKTKPICSYHSAFP